MHKKETIQKIIDLRKQNKSIEYISNITGISCAGLRVWLSKHKIYKSDNKIEIIDNLSTEELAYIAGIIDGEGSIVISKLSPNKNKGEISNKYQLYMKVVNTDKRLIEYLSNKTLTTFFTEKYRKNRENTRLTFSIHWPVNITLYILDKIYPFLVIKKEQVDVAREFKKTFDKKYSKNTIPKNIINTRKKCYLKMKELHSREFE